MPFNHQSMAFVAAAIAFAPVIAGCSTRDAASCASPGGPVPGPVDSHCSVGGVEVVQATNPASCMPDAGTAGDASADSGAPVYGAPVYNTESDDDDCKYHVVWSTTPVCENENTTFTVTATNKTDGSPVTGANVLADVFLTDVHIAPNSGRTTLENPPGTYTIGPIRFDAPGQWTVRFHFFEECSDAPPDSPHGHAAFYVNVP
jgi:hypothetical protein